LSVAGRDAERTVRGELPRLILAAIAIVAIYLVVHFRSAGDALLSLIPTIFGMLVVAAALGLAGPKLNMVNLVAIPLLIGIDVDYGIFLVNMARLRQVRLQTGDELAGRIAPPVHAVIVCAVATILGYISLLWTSVPAERSLGIAAAAGIGTCLLGVLFLLLPVLFRLSRRA
jgi:predicted RND superfamily exporter protein